MSAKGGSSVKDKEPLRRIILDKDHEEKSARPDRPSPPPPPPVRPASPPIEDPKRGLEAAEWRTPKDL